MSLAVIIPTDRCNLRCKHCMRTQYPEGDLKINTLLRFLLGFQKYGLEKKFCLTGGEPTLHKKFYEILKILKDFGFKGSLVTNGQVEEKTLEEIIKYKDTLNHTTISLEGPDEKINDAIRGRGSFKNIIKSIDFLKNNGLQIRIHVTLHSKNLGLIEGFFLFAKNHKVDEILFGTIEPCENTEKNGLLDEIEFIQKDYEKYLSLRKKFKAKTFFTKRHFIPYIQADWPHSMCTPMRKNLGELVLRPNGDVSFCCDVFDFGFARDRYKKEEKNQKLSHILGNVDQDDFGDILARKKKLISLLLDRRRRDATDGKLIGARQFICENCKFYFYG